MSPASIKIGLNLTSLGGVRGYLGQVATASRVPSSFTGTSTMMMSAAPHILRDAVSQFKIIIPNFYVTALGVETGPGASATVTASIEYPLNSGFTQVLFGGLAQATIANNDMVVSDWITNPGIPGGGTFRTRIFYQCASGIIFVGDGWINTNGARAEFSTTGITDKTMGGSIASPGGGAYMPDVAVLGMTSKKTVWVAGDSRQEGVNDTGDVSTDTGEIPRCISSLAYINGGTAGDRASWAKTNYSKRLTLAGYCSNIISGYGRNDIYGASSSLATLQADTLAFRALFASTKPFDITTVIPDTTSTDTFATVANQTVVAVKEGIRTSYNAWVRAGGISGVRNTYDLAAAIEVNSSGVLTTDGGFWPAPGYTTDGIHESQTANLQIKNSGILTSAMV
ncbi:hypothetical protein IVB03_39595 [Bradyrhizobium sp. 168]|uniref:hypothetical protein n=1 Tax=Bradyrhizobium sp. 168 TaxID=2782639 RepID=UPI001FFA0A73|nr:hypothetical protein [Bradyrhizobium sp. 168]MCK1585501.1 hypothetical protein [Bradyrhizobium sp. 168]